MRGLTKAAALLSVAFASAVVVPDPSSSGVEVVNPWPLVESYASKTVLSFDLDTFRRDDPFSEQTNFTLEIDSSDVPCGQSNLRFQGRHLETTWDSVTLTGHGFIPRDESPISATWHVLCLVDAVERGSGSYPRDAIQVLSFALQLARQDSKVGFTVSYSQVGTPRVLQFRPHPSSRRFIESEHGFWRSPSTFKPIIATEKVEEANGVHEVENVEQTYEHSTNKKQNVLMDQVKTLSNYIGNKLAGLKSAASNMVQSCRHHVQAFKTKVHQVMVKLCPSQSRMQDVQYFKSSVTFPTNTAHTISAPNSPIEAAQADRLSDVIPPAQTRSLHSPTSTSTSTNPLSTPSSASIHSTSSSLHSPPTPFHFLKLVFIALTLFSLLSWIFIRLKDPRRRADRAARREEARNRKLYRRAAWRHWWQTRICAIRHRHCPRSRGLGTSDTWDEKRMKVIQQEQVLEAVCQADIAHLRAATRPRPITTNSMAAAEEGRNVFIYDSDSEVGSARRLRSISGRSVSTLPGYESEGTQPPGYGTDDISPDSSVVSTSPRISRDGTMGSSEEGWAVGKDIEALDLGPGITRRTYPDTNTK
ncbi:MAG: hypothetical protein Q9191_003892 [Dirinaria sp. TL-2023a]